MSAGASAPRPRPSWVTNSIVCSVTTRVDLCDEEAKVPRLPSDVDLAPPTGPLPHAPFFLGGALSNYNNTIDLGPGHYFRTAYKFWAVRETLTSGGNKIWVFARSCQSVYPEPAYMALHPNAPPSSYSSILSEYWVQWDYVERTLWPRFQQRHARVVPREDYMRQDGTHRLFTRKKINFPHPSLHALVTMVTWSPDTTHLDRAMRNVDNYQPMVSGPTSDQLLQWHSINKTIVDDDDDDHIDDEGNKENGE